MSAPATASAQAVSPSHSQRTRAILAILFISAIWGCTFVFVKRALDDVSPILFIALRFGFGTLLLAGVMRGRWWPDRKDRTGGLKAAFLTGVILFTGYVLQTAGLRQSTAAKAAFLTGLYIPLVPLLGALVYRTVPRVAEVAGLVLATVGTLLLTLPDGADWSGLLSVNRGDLLVIAATVAWALQIIVVGHYSKQYSSGLLAVGQVGTCGLLGIASFWWLETPKIVWSAQAITGIVFSACIATALAFGLQTWAQKHVSANRTALLFATEPMFAWAAAFLVSGEMLGTRGMTGAGLILASVLLVEMKPERIIEHPSG